MKSKYIIGAITAMLTIGTPQAIAQENTAMKEFTLEDAAKVLEDTYGIGHEQALADADKWVKSLRNCNVIE